MSKSKRKTGTELEHLRGKVKELSRENRSLKKQVKALEKYSRQQESDTSSDENEELVEYAAALFESTAKQKVPCHECGKGFYNEFEIAGKVIGTCSVCDHRKKLYGN